SKKKFKHPCLISTECKTRKIITFNKNTGSSNCLRKSWYLITTGGSVKEIIKVVEGSKGEVVGAGCLINRSCNKIAFMTKRKIKIQPKSLLSLKIKTYSQARCPLCKKEVSLIRPGSESIRQPK
ncbi:hypothetical protein KAU05_01635, partial [Candidatus Aerophobetes bacterium]|nr:hypothetical protein [Candidatus Aerophobetes bacterium]